MNILQKKSKRPHVVIVGAGFGGLKTAQLLAKHPIDITIIDKNNYLVYRIKLDSIEIINFRGTKQKPKY